jgi:hypothetical protein
MRSRGFRPLEYSRLAADHGWPVRWYRAVRCPCWQRETGGPQADCPACSGTGYQYTAGIDGTLNLRAEERLRRTDHAERTEGSITVSVPAQVLDRSVTPHVLADNPLYEMGDHDRIVLTTSRLRQDDTLVRGDHERLRYAEVVEIVEIVGVSEAGRVVYAAADYMLDGGAITWVDERGPGEGEQYSVLYWARPEYIVRNEVGAERLHSGQRLPKRFVLDLRDRGVLTA